MAMRAALASTVVSWLALASTACGTSRGPLPSSASPTPLPRCTASNAGSSWDRAAKPWIIGHRGSGNVTAPENTLRAFQAATDAGAGIETDIRQTADGVLVLIHDDTTLRTTGVPGTVADTPYDQLAQLDASYVFHPETFGPERIPTLFALVSTFGPKTTLLLELKAGDALAAVNEVARLDACESAVFQSFDRGLLDRGASGPERARMQLLTGDPESVVVPLLSGMNVWGVGVLVDVLTPTYVSAIHDRGLVTMAWVVDDISTAERLLAFGVDGLISDDPAYLARLIRQVSPSGTTVAPSNGYLGSGWRLRRRAGGTAVVLDQFATWDVPSVAATDLALIYPGIRTPGAPWRLDTTIRLQRAGPDPSGEIGLRFGFPADNDDGTKLYGAPSPGTGYVFGYRAGGSVNLSRVASGVPTVVASSTWKPLASGDTIPLTVTVTGNELAIARTDTGEQLTASDASNGRSGFLSVFGVGELPAAGASRLEY